jgi:hypothetical protein
VIKRNYIDPLFCPVIAILTWLRISGIESGPIFPKSNRGTSKLVPGVYNKSANWQARWNRLSFVRHLRVTSKRAPWFLFISELDQKTVRLRERFVGGLHIPQRPGFSSSVGCALQSAGEVSFVIFQRVHSIALFFPVRLSLVPCITSGSLWSQCSVKPSPASSAGIDHSTGGEVVDELNVFPEVSK